VLPHDLEHVRVQLGIVWDAGAAQGGVNAPDADHGCLVEELSQGYSHHPRVARYLQRFTKNDEWVKALLEGGFDTRNHCRSLKGYDNQFAADLQRFLGDEKCLALLLSTFEVRPHVACPFNVRKSEFKNVITCGSCTKTRLLKRKEKCSKGSGNLILPRKQLLTASEDTDL
jgi:hypothetical protein